MTNPKNRRGFTLMEVSVVLAISAVIIGSVWAASGTIGQQQKANEAYDEIQTVVNNIISLKQAQGKTFSSTNWTDITKDMIDAKAIPPAYVNQSDSKYADGPWKPKGFVVSERADAASGKGSFRIVFSDPAVPGCVSLVTRILSCEAGQPGCPFKVHTKNASKTKDPDATKGWTTLTPDEIIDLCDENVEGASSVGFDYYL